MQKVTRFPCRVIVYFRSERKVTRFQYIYFRVGGGEKSLHFYNRFGGRKKVTRFSCRIILHFRNERKVTRFQHMVILELEGG